MYLRFTCILLISYLFCLVLQRTHAFHTCICLIEMAPGCLKLLLVSCRCWSKAEMTSTKALSSGPTNKNSGTTHSFLFRWRLLSIDAVNWESPSSGQHKSKSDVDVVFATMPAARCRLCINSVYIHHCRVPLLLLALLMLCDCISWLSVLIYRSFYYVDHRDNVDPIP